MRKCKPGQHVPKQATHPILLIGEVKIVDGALYFFFPEIYFNLLQKES